MVGPSIGAGLRVLRDGARDAVDAGRDQVVETTHGLFSHGPVPLADTLQYLGDPGLLGPDSVSWRVIGDVSAFVGGIRALLIQAAHPEVVAGVADHSTYQEDPLGRLSRTSFYVTATTYGAMPEVEEAVAVVRRAHAPVRGESSRGRPYSAGTPELAAWVHNALTDSFLVAYQHYGRVGLTAEEADRFVVEQQSIGRLLDADPLPSTAAELSAWLENHPAVASSSGQREAVEFLRKPPLALPVRAAYRLLFGAAAVTIPEKLRSAIGVEPGPRDEAIGRVALSSLRWALGSSPSWHVALVRTGGAIPDGVFRQPLSAEAKAVLRGAE